MKVVIIAAVAANGGIGKNNDLLWHLPNDMKFFKDQTLNTPVIMGRRNYDSIPEPYRPLNDRLNIIITRNPDFEATGCLVFNSIEQSLDYCRNQGFPKVFIIGGGEIYGASLKANFVDEMLITEVDAVLDADTFFPSLNEKQWAKELLQTQEKDHRHAYSFSIFRYILSGSK